MRRAVLTALCCSVSRVRCVEKHGDDQSFSGIVFKSRLARAGSITSFRTLVVANFYGLYFVFCEYGEEESTVL